MKAISRSLSLSQRRALWGIVLVAPCVIGLMFFFGLPTLMAFRQSLWEWNGIRPPVDIGLRNFVDLFQDPKFWNSLGVTFKLALIVVPIEIMLALGIATLLNQKLRGRSILRTIYFLPVVTSTVAASIVWTWIFQPRYGMVAGILAPFGFSDLQWLTRPDLILIPIAVVTIWQRIGFDMVLFLAGLQNIPRDLHEAAMIDGANVRQRFFKVTLPMLSPTTFLITVLAGISALQIFDQVFIMTARTTRGGVGGSASTLAYFLYDSGFGKNQYGYASAISLVLFLIILIITVIQFAIQRRWVYYESGD